MPALNNSNAYKQLAVFAANAPLGDPAQPSAPVSLQLPEQAWNIPTKAGAGSFTLSADAETSVAIVNEKTDPDPEGYFGLGVTAAVPGETGDSTPALDAPAKFDPNLAYVILTGLRLSGKLGGAFTIGSEGKLGLDGSGALEIGQCVCFPRTELTWNAITTAIAQFKTVFSAQDLVNLTVWGTGQPNPGQILTFGLQSNLTLSLALTASSVAGTVAGAMTSVLGRGGAFSLTTSPSARLAVSLSASDGFRVFAHRAAAGSVTFAIKKDRSATLSVAGTLGVKVGFSETELNALVNGAFEQVAGLGEGSLVSLLDTAKITPEQVEKISQVTQRLGIADTVNSGIDSLKKKLAELREEIVKRLKPTVTAQFAYTWRRLTSDSLVAQFTVPDALIPTYHADILSLNLETLLNRGVSDGIVFTRLLGQAKTQFDIGYGFSFGVNGYTFLKSWDSLQTKFVEVRRLTPSGEISRQSSFLGKRAYDASWFNRSQTNYVELDASMPSPTVTALTLADFEFGLSLAFTWEGHAFKDIVEVVADHGCVVTAFETGDVMAAKESLVAAGLDLQATGSVVVSVKVEDLALRRLLDVLTSADYGSRLAPNALARSLPFTSDYPERAGVDRRMQVYGQVCMNFLGAETLERDTISKLCRVCLPQVTLGGKVSPLLINNEASSNMLAWSAQGTIAMTNPAALQQAVNHELPTCFDLLARQSGDYAKVLPACVQNFSTLAAQNYGCRVLASLLVLAAATTPGGLSLLSRSVVFSWSDGDKERTIVVKPRSS